ncbi:MAG: 3-phosphoglycerate dehydrogenase family protein [Clostridia bacterium]|nr:3-phosphoglycerate dehydrogenase family protein [Clostridia bacterium]
MYNILKLNKISSCGTDMLNGEKFSCSDEVKNPDAILVRSAKMHDFELPENLLAIARAGAGVNNIPVEKCIENGVVVFNTPGANANAVKELIMCMLFLTSRKIIPGIEFAKSLAGKGDEIPKLIEKGKAAFVGPEIKGKTLGVIGLGAIGASVANAAIDLGMNVRGYDPFLSIDAAWNLNTSIIHSTTLDDIFENSDYITLHLPATADTKNMINSESIAKMKDNVRLLNFSRDDLVSTDDVVEGLSNGKIAAYATDFVNEQLLATSGVIPVPHLGASTPESEDNCAKMAVSQLIDYIENGNIRNSVNMPTSIMDRTAPVRVCAIHKNIPTMISKITQPFTDAGININDLLNRSKGNFAYTMVDVESVTDELIDTINNIDGIIRVRVLK